MGTEVLYPQDVLSERLRIPHASFQRRSMNRRSGGGASHRKTSPRAEKKKVNPGEENGGAKRGIQGRKDDGAATGQVTLLRRGESLDSLTAKIKSGNPKMKSPERKPVYELAASSNKGSELAVSKPIWSSAPPRLDGYAGSAFALSPSPQSLPLPSFFNKKQQSGSRSVDDSATRDLRRLLRLD